MTLYSVYARDAEAPAAVADRFSWFAALLPPLHFIVHGLWLALIAWVVAMVGLGWASLWIGGEATFWLYLLSALLIGFEAATLRRLQLARRGWRYRTEMVALGEDLALVDYLKRQPQ